MRPGLIPRVTGFGAASGLAAILFWIGFTFRPETFVLPYVAAVALTAACGAFILLATWYDSARHPRRGARIRHIRGFDIVAGLVLAAPSLWALWPFLRAF